jgi:hypothetical protein
LFGSASLKFKNENTKEANIGKMVKHTKPMIQGDKKTQPQICCCRYNEKRFSLGMD